MKKQFYFLTGILFLLPFFFAGCGGGGSLPSNPYLGDLPSLANQYQSEIDEYEAKADAATDMQDAFEYNARAKNLDKEAEGKIKEAWEKMETPVAIPFSQTAKEDFVIQQVVVDKAMFNQLNIRMDAMLSTTSVNLFAYLCAVDEQEQEIPGTFSVLMSTRHPKKDTIARFTGIMRPIQNLSKLAEFKFVTKDYYNAHKND
jgi:hypothetical protein